MVDPGSSRKRTEKTPAVGVREEIFTNLRRLGLQYIVSNASSVGKHDQSAAVPIAFFVGGCRYGSGAITTTTGRNRGGKVPVVLR